MKTPVAVATVICGTLLLITPYANAAFGAMEVSATIAKLNREFSLTNGMPGWYDGGCFVVGALMIVVGIGASLRREA